MNRTPLLLGRLSFWHLAIIAAASIVVLLIIQPARPLPPRPSGWQPPQILTRAERSEGTPVPLRGRAIAGPGVLQLAVDDGLYADQREPLAAEAEAALAYVADRFGTPPRAPFVAGVQRDGSCGLHGIAYTGNRDVRVFSCDSIDRQRAINILAHEIVHQLAHDRYGDAHLRADLVLLEGVATWGAGSYWLAGQPDFRTLVRKQRAAGAFLPLGTHYQSVGIAGMNTLYYQWASFTEFLLATYGRDRLDQLYVSGNRAPGSADYAGILGRDFATLEADWLAWLDQ